jgi:hypothetical protein
VRCNTLSLSFGPSKSKDQYGAAEAYHICSDQASPQGLRAFLINQELKPRRLCRRCERNQITPDGAIFPPLVGRAPEIGELM